MHHFIHGQTGVGFLFMWCLQSAQLHSDPCLHALYAFITLCRETSKEPARARGLHHTWLTPGTGSQAPDPATVSQSLHRMIAPAPTQTTTCSTQGFGQNDRRNATSKSSFQRWHFKDWNLKCCMLCWAQCNSMGISVLWSKLKWFNFFCFIKLQEKIMIKMKHKMKLNMFFL